MQPDTDFKVSIVDLMAASEAAGIVITCTIEASKGLLVENWGKGKEEWS